MSVLTNPKHEAFCQELVKGKTADEAYVLAGYAENRHNASRMKTNETIQARIAELQAAVAEQVVERSAVTKEWLLGMLETNARMAQEAGKFEASTSAVKLLGSELHGMFVDKKEVGKPGEFDGIDAAQLRRSIAERLRVAGQGIGKASPVGEQGSVRDKPARVH